MKSIHKTLFAVLVVVTGQLIVGQNYQEIQRLQNEYKKVLELQALQKPTEISDAEKTASSTALPDKLIYSRKDIESLLGNTEKLLEQLKFLEDSTKKMPYIGYDIFTHRDTIPFWQNLPIPKEYSLGPGDEIIISLWGEIEAYDSEVINRDGQVYVQNIGILNLGGKTITDAKKYVLSKYSSVYSTLIGNNPKSYVDITLGELKSVNVHFVGFVNIPGVHMIHPFSNVVTGLTQAGGIDIMGSLRNIQVIRNGQLIGSVDLYNYMFLGQTVGDIRLLDQDIIYVPTRKSTIPLTGRVRKPGFYEIIENESLEYLIKIAGGTDARSSRTLFVYKNGAEPDENTGYLLNASQTTSFQLTDGDSVHVPLKPDAIRFVYIDGQVKNPGQYPFQNNMNLKDLFDATMSAVDLDFMRTIDLTNITVNRKNPDGRSPIQLRVDGLNSDFKLANGDHITIARLDWFQPIESVQITGEIKTPGIYPVNNLTSLVDLLDLAGGYTDKALENGIKIYRDSIQIAWDHGDFILKDNDSLNVLKKTGLVLLSGEVNVPGYVSYRKGDSIKNYIKRAGGYSAFAETRDVLIIYPNGTAIPKSRWSSPKVMDGSTIIVNQRTLSGSSKGPTGWQAFSIISSQAGNVATTLLTLILLMNQTSG